MPRRLAGRAAHGVGSPAEPAETAEPGRLAVTTPGSTRRSSMDCSNTQGMSILWPDYFGSCSSWDTGPRRVVCWCTTMERRAAPGATGATTAAMAAWAAREVVAWSEVARAAEGLARGCSSHSRTSHCPHIRALECSRCAGSKRDHPGTGRRCHSLRSTRRTCAMTCNTTRLVPPARAVAEAARAVDRVARAATAAAAMTAAEALHK